MFRKKKENDDDTPKAKVHPRIWRRNVAVKREIGQRRLRFLSTTLALLAIVGVSVLILLSPLLNIDRINIIGAPPSMHEQILQGGNIHKGDPLIKVRPNKAEKKIKSLPNIASAQIQMHWPHEVKITVTLRTPAAVFVKKKNYQIVSEEGVVMQVTKTMPTDLVLVDGTVVARKPGQILSDPEFEVVRFIIGLTPETQTRIAKVTIHPDHTVTATLKVGTKGETAIAQLGEPRQMDAKAVALQTILANITLRPGQVIDVRNAQTPVVSGSTTTTSTTTTVLTQPKSTVSTVFSGGNR